ncbi:DNA mismatch repair endonuclease MutL [Nosocomiicoccus massiliensis]|uniref:DNA mismatch repair protein MutL n=1 Tax=Nosocomiicoccus massiliensis TaxID=1232430 RepID=A0AAF1BMT3_9STAP|nr:DNA mismatch repair endonuclease MutL [Nosocomiicoccus massiliensis]WOS96334.1 DNA mismatch repair endonuclease MutL [Nosocomiicoccus massiliensis]
MERVHVLDPVIQNKIAAGEVVERPSSIVKELVENSIDANATSIEVFIEESGLKMIRVVDNGEGIDDRDSRLIFERHATSKIAEDYDLFEIRSMGFRGEALASIGAVSKATVESYRKDRQPFKLEYSGGREVNYTDGKSRVGTVVTIEDLFFNTPARYKYIKSLQTEAGRIIDIMQRFSFNHPHIQFKLAFDGKVRFHTKGNGNLQEVISDVYGLNVARHSVKVEAKTPDYKLSGFIVRPEITRSNKNYINLAINSRIIKDFRLVQSVVEAYHTLLPKDKYPVVILNIDMDPKLVDVNVHPAKTEVRLSKLKELQQLIEQTIREELRSERLIPEIEAREKTEKPVMTQNVFDFSSRPVFDNTFNEYKRENIFSNKEGKTQNNFDFNTEKRDEVSYVNTPIEEHMSHSRESYDDYNDSKLPYLEIVGQIHGTYIVMQNDEGMYLMDQHAAQERIKYEYFYENIQNSDERVPLLLPYHFEFSYDDVIRIDEKLKDLKALGFNIEKTGIKQYTVTEYPSWILKDDPEGDIESVIDFISNTDEFSVNKYREEMSIMMSCKQSIKANHYLDLTQMRALLKDLSQCKSPYTCPHGRPVIIKWTTYEIEKMFNRIMK